ncbi:hypothetical protein [Pedobacter miscanthi]|jgi:hypothetical protein|uniref:hypothetical protein n=1 Tax=Pedobacter miscanthi TaxID=2259170 RepID=UPI002930F61D|nr:hypothetical protein [Pedobacter miscanthi]
MLKKSLLAVLMLLNVSVALNAKTGVPAVKKHAFFACTFTPNNSNLSYTYASTSFSLTSVNYAATYFGSNPYSQGQWEVGVVIGSVDCHPATYIYGRKLQADGRIMETGITASGYVVVKWVSGPPMPSSGPMNYAVEMGNVNISSTGG